MTDDEAKTGINNFFKYNVIGVVIDRGGVYAGKQFVGRHAAILVFMNGPVLEKTKKIETSTALMPAVIKLYNANPAITIHEIAGTLGVARETVRRCVGKINLQVPGRLNIRSGQKLTAKEIMPQVSKLIQEDPNRSNLLMARKLGVHRSTLTKAVELLKKKKEKLIKV
jgi:predicted HTH transcriptional regulator